jgi:propanol-preferring alcohol dehydrogenase
MRAAVLKAFGEPLVISETPVPEPGVGEVLVKVETCGVCHSDLHLAGGEWDMLRPITKLPLVLGHEIAGTVAQLGEGVTDFVLGERVGVPWLHWTCGDCEFCTTGRETLCSGQMITGCTVDGGFAEFVKAKATHIARLPEGLSSEAAAPLLCAGLTAHKALKSSGLKPGERLAVFGIGGLGHLAVQLGREIGAEVIAVDVAEDKLAMAQDYGAAATFNAVTGNVPRELRKLGGAHVAIVTSASKAAYETALRSLRKGGTLMVVGMSPEPVNVSTVALVSGETRILGSAIGTRQDLAEVLALGAAGRIACRIRTAPLSEVNQILNQMREGQLLGRVVVKI